MTRAVALLAGLTVLALSPAHAIPVTWQLTGTFNDGGTVSGTFTYDADTNAYSAVGVSTFQPSDPMFPSAVYTGLPTDPCIPTDPMQPGDPMIPSDPMYPVFFPGDPMDAAADGSCQAPAVGMLLSSALDNGGGVRTVVLTSASGEGSFYHSGPGSTLGGGLIPTRLCTAGTVTAVPLPGAVLLFGGALGVMGVMRRKVIV